VTECYEKKGLGRRGGRLHLSIEKTCEEGWGICLVIEKVRGERRSDRPVTGEYHKKLPVRRPREIQIFRRYQVGGGQAFNRPFKRIPQKGTEKNERSPCKGEGAKSCISTTRLEE